MRVLLEWLADKELPGVVALGLLVGLTFLKLLPYIRKERERRERQKEMDQ